MIGRRVQSWVDGTGADGLLLHAAVTAAESAASQWNRDLAADENRYDAAVDEWNAYFRAEGIEAIGYGTLCSAVASQRSRGSPSWRCPRTWAGRRAHNCCGSSTRPTRRRRTTRRCSGSGFVPVPTARLTQSMVRDSGGWRGAGTDLTVVDSIELKAHIDETTHQLLLALDGRATVGEVLSARLSRRARPRTTPRRGSRSCGACSPRAI